MPTTKTLVQFDALAGQPPATGYPQLDLRNGIVVLDFDDTSDESIDFLGLVPLGYAGSDLEVVVTWSATSATTGDVFWQSSFERHPLGDATYGTFDLDSSAFGTLVDATATAPSSSGQIARTTLSLPALTAQLPEGGESFRLRLLRQATDVADTLAGDVELLTLELREV